MDWADRTILNYEIYGLQRLNNFWVKVEKTDSCWNWTATLNYADRTGYGVFGLDRKRNKNITSHRFSWILSNGDIPKELDVLHKCDNPKCVNTEHLFLGTHKDNLHDASIKGRINRGEKNHSAKLTENQVKEIRERYFKGGITQMELSKEYNINQTNISGLIRKKTWGYLK